jgi:hypothetical protein
MRTKHPLSVLILASLFLLSFSRKGGEEETETKPFSKAFCGKITYTVIVESKCPLLDTRKLQKMFGTSMTLYIKDGAYKMMYNGTAVKEVLYVGKENKQFIVMGETDSVLWRKCTKISGGGIRTYMRREQCSVMNHECDALSIENDWSTTTYLFDPKMRLNPKDFKNHGFDYLNTYIRKARAPYLKCVYDGPDYKTTMIATDVEEMELNDDIFQLGDLPVMSSGI